MEIVRPFAGFQLGQTLQWENPEYAYDNDLNTYAVATASQYWFRLPQLTEQQIQKLKIMVIPHGIASNMHCGVGYGTSADDHTILKSVAYVPDGESYAEIELTDAQLNTLYQHRDTVCILLRNVQNVMAEISEVYAVIDNSAIYVGNKQASEIYVGTTKASAYVGTTKVL